MSAPITHSRKQAPTTKDRKADEQKAHKQKINLNPTFTR